MHARLRGTNNSLTLVGPDFPSLADERAKQRPDMNNKVTAFTVTKKLYYMRKCVTLGFMRKLI